MRTFREELHAKAVELHRRLKEIERLATKVKVNSVIYSEETQTDIEAIIALARDANDSEEQSLMSKVKLTHGDEVQAEFETTSDNEMQVTVLEFSFGRHAHRISSSPDGTVIEALSNGEVVKVLYDTRPVKEEGDNHGHV
ncbi:MAG: hypothetical protein ACW99U_19255 [Candidatus Thorarchaeota archaeon]|jgi:hypothetical protein